MSGNDIEDQMAGSSVVRHQDSSLPGETDLASHPQISESGSAAAPAVKAGETDGLFFNWGLLTSYLLLLREYYRLYAAVLLVAIFLAGINCWLAQPVYTAVAVIGPPGPSPTGALVGTGGGLHSVLGSSLLGGSGSGVHDSYQDLLQLLPSSRLSQALIDRDGILQILYADQWDTEKKQWKSPGAVHAASNAVKRMRNFVVSNQPGVDDLSKFFDGHFSIVHANTGSSAGLLAKQSPYMVASFTYSTPAGAENLLRMILSEADRLVRDVEGRDVAARIDFLRRELSQQNLSIDERAALISILSGQEQLQAMIHADERYASTLIVPPHAPLEPTSPPGLSKIASQVIVWSILGWIVLVVLGAHFERVRRLITWARRKKFTVLA